MEALFGIVCVLPSRTALGQAVVPYSATPQPQHREPTCRVTYGCRNTIDSACFRGDYDLSNTNHFLQWLELCAICKWQQLQVGTLLSRAWCLSTQLGRGEPWIQKPSYIETKLSATLEKLRAEALQPLYQLFLFGPIHLQPLLPPCGLLESFVFEALHIY